MPPLSWRVLSDTTLTGALLRDLQGLWDPSSARSMGARSLLDEVDSRFAVLVAEDGAEGRLLGAALGGYSDNERLGVLDYVFVAPEHRGHGLGRALVDRVTDEIRDRVDVLFADAEQTGEEFLRVLGWRLIPPFGGHSWTTSSRRLTTFPRSPAAARHRLAVRALRPAEIDCSIMLSADGSGEWTRAILAAMMRGSIDARDLDDATGRAVHALLASRSQ